MQDIWQHCPARARGLQNSPTCCAPENSRALRRNGHMADRQRAPEIRGKTMRWTWTDGPTKGTTHEHVFHEYGTVEWRCTDGPHKGQSAKEAEYAAQKVADDAYVVSYLAAS